MNNHFRVYKETSDKGHSERGPIKVKPKVLVYTHRITAKEDNLSSLQRTKRLALKAYA